MVVLLCAKNCGTIRKNNISLIFYQRNKGELFCFWEIRVYCAYFSGTVNSYFWR
jgi:hypothetical protein